jgi:hypothetical protein
VEDVGPTQHGERGEIAAEAPATDADLGHVEEGVVVGQVEQSAHLIVEHRAGQVEVNGALPLRTASWCTPAVDDHHREALIGEPLRAEIRGAGADHPLHVWTSVGIDEHRQQRRAVVVARQHERALGSPLAGARERHVRRFERDHGARRHHRSAVNPCHAAVDDESRGAGDDGRTPDDRGVHAGIVGDAHRTVGLRPGPHVLLARFGVRGGREHDASVAGRDDAPQVDVGGGHFIAADHETSSTVARRARHETIAVEPAGGAGDQVGPCLVVVGEQRGGGSGRDVDGAYLEVVLVA